MKTLRLILLLLTGFLPSVFFGQEGPDPVRVMSFNIRYDNPSDSIYSWDNRKEQVFRVIRTEKPDIAGLQEVLCSQVKDLRKALPGYRPLGVGREDGKKKGEYAAILYRKELFQLVRTSAFWLSETPSVPGSRSWETACTRIVTWAELRDRRSGRHLFVFNTHLDHVSQLAREKSAALILDSIGAIAGAAPVILTGDFNCTSADKAYRILAGKLDDCLLVAKNVQSFPTTYVGFPADPDRNEVIDHIFVSRRKNVVVSNYEVITFHEGSLYPSDHLPVETVLDY